jgi:hypothetical protein
VATTSFNRAWNLEAFLDALVVELDRARDTLAIKALNRPLSYSVKDVGLQLQIFPQFDGQQVHFTTAQPGQTGASELRVDLGSITARTIKETAPEPITKDDVSIDALDIDSEAKKTLDKLGVKSSRDVERIEERNVDIQRLTENKLDYQGLANVISKARRRQRVPTVARAGIATEFGETVLAITGENLVTHPVPEFPVALLDGERVPVLSSSDRSLRLRVDPRRIAGRNSKLEIALDPFAVLALELKA